MHVSIRRSLFKIALDVLKPFVATRASLPILECLLLDVSRSAVQIRVTDGDHYAWWNMDGADFDVKEPGQYAIDFNTVRKILAGKYLSLDVDVQSRDGLPPLAKITADGMVYEVVSHIGDDYAAFPVLNDELDAKLQSATFSKSAIHEALLRTAPFTSQDITRLALNRVYFVVDGSVAKFAATDTNVLSIYPVECHNYYDKTPWNGYLTAKMARAVSICPTKTRVELRHTPVNQGPAEITTIRTGPLTVATKDPDGGFPNYGRVVPRSTVGAMTLPAADLRDHIARARRQAEIGAAKKGDTVGVTFSYRPAHAPNPGLVDLRFFNGRKVIAETEIPGGRLGKVPDRIALGLGILDTALKLVGDAGVVSFHVQDSHLSPALITFSRLSVDWVLVVAPMHPIDGATPFTGVSEATPVEAPVTPEEIVEAERTDPAVIEGEAIIRGDGGEQVSACEVQDGDDPEVVEDDTITAEDLGIDLPSFTPGPRPEQHIRMESTAEAVATAPQPVVAPQPVKAAEDAPGEILVYIHWPAPKGIRSTNKTYPSKAKAVKAAAYWSAQHNLRTTVQINGAVVLTCNANESKAG